MLPLTNATHSPIASIEIPAKNAANAQGFLHCRKARSAQRIAKHASNAPTQCIGTKTSPGNRYPNAVPTAANSAPSHGHAAKNATPNGPHRPNTTALAAKKPPAAKHTPHSTRRTRASSRRFPVSA